MILAAGLGTRLRPLTDGRPKPLVPVANKPALERIIAYLRGHGINSLAVNAHHHAGMLSQFLGDGGRFGVSVDIKFEPRILGTGGGILNAADALAGGTFVVMNGDVLTDIDLGEALRSHRASGRTATLVVHDHPHFNQIMVAEDGEVLDIATRPGPDRLAFTGIHILEPRIFEILKRGGHHDIVECYREMAAGGDRAGTWKSRGAYWRDIGAVDAYLLANKELSPMPFLAHPNAFVHPLAVLEEWAVVGARSRVGAGVRLCRSVIWEEAELMQGVSVADSVVTSGRRVERDLKSEVL